MPRLHLIPNDTYSRSDLHAKVMALAPSARGGNRQSGISFDHAAKVVMFFTGDGSRDHPYDDGWYRNVFWYSGQGLNGDMTWTPYNATLLAHDDLGYELHGFHGPLRYGMYTYLGEFRCAGYITDQVPGTDGRERKAFMFLLSPLGPVVHGPGVVAARYLAPDMQARATNAMQSFAGGVRPRDLPRSSVRRRLALTPQPVVRPPLPPEFTEVTDGVGVRTIRREQDRLRDYLLSAGEANECCVCGAALPPSLLVAAHLKPRHACTQAERRDVNVVRLMCTLGCDALYEHRYIHVKEGVVVAGRATSAFSSVSARVEAVLGRHIKDWQVSQAYFSWHHAHVII